MLTTRFAMVGFVRIWDTKSGKMLVRLEGNDAYLWAIAFSSGASPLLAAGGDSGPITLWNPLHGEKPIGILKGSKKGIKSLAFSPDGRILAAGDYDSTLRLWNVARQTQLGKPIPLPRYISALAFSHDGKTLVAGSGDGTITWLDVAGRRKRMTRHAHTLEVTRIAFSPDDTMIVTGDEDGTVKLWDARSGDQVASFKPFAAHVGGLAFAPDGHTLIAAGCQSDVRSDVVLQSNAAGTPSGLTADIYIWEAATEREVYRTCRRAAQQAADDPESQRNFVRACWGYAASARRRGRRCRGPASLSRRARRARQAGPQRPRQRTDNLEGGIR